MFIMTRIQQNQMFDPCHFLLDISKSNKQEQKNYIFQITEK